MAKFFAAVMTLLLHALRAMTRSRADVVLENLALREQVMVLKEKRPRPSLDDGHRVFWVALRSVWSLWTKLLVSGATGPSCPSATVAQAVHA